MKRKLFGIIVFISCCLLGGGLRGQSVSFSQFYASRMYLNPAYTGLQNGLTAAAAYREQWTNVPGRFRSVFASVDMGCGNDGLGVSILHNNEGQGSLSTMEIKAHYARTIPLINNNVRNKLFLHIGASVGWGNKRVDWPRLIFSDQLHPVLGVVLPQSPGAVPIIQSKDYFTNAVGAVLRFDLIGRKRRRSEAKNVIGELGFAVGNLFRPNESLQNLETLLPRKYTVHGGLFIPLTAKRAGVKHAVVALSPNFKFDLQGGINVLTYGLYATYLNRFFLGAFYQNTYLTYDAHNTNSFIFTGGIRLDGTGSNDWYDLGYSYDANPMGLSLRTAGVHEITLRAHFGDVCLFGPGKNKRRFPNKIECPVFQ